MKKTVFYSWQSDLPNGTNRTLIENALREAAAEISKDENVDVEPVIDRDTQGVAGAPDIAATIFKKIDSAAIFVADISIVVNSKKRSTPNPNVLIELGYAFKSLGHERLVLVFNEASGKKEKLPFDLKTKRILTYSCAESLEDRSEVKKNLIKDLKSALLTGFTHTSTNLPLTPTSPSIVDIIKNNTPSKKIELRNYLGSVLSDLDRLQPKMARDDGTVDDLLAALPKTEALVTTFAKTAETIVLMNDFELAKDIFNWFGKLLERYNPFILNGRITSADGDFFKFVGHELFVAFINPFLKEEKFKELHELLKGTLRVGVTGQKQNETKESWTDLSDFSPLLDNESKKRGKTSLRADILKNRHENGELSNNLPLKDFTNTDFFLYLHREGSTADEYYGNWYPQSVLWLNSTPSYVLEAVDYPKAMQLCHALAISDIEELKKRLMSGRRLADIPHFAIPERDIRAIGTTGGASVVRLDRDPF